jgi:translation initiation factor IF-2
MAEVTVKQLAEDVGAPVDRLLKLLAYLRKTHGEADAEPRKITLKRKTTTTLKAGKAKTVNVEVRKRRTYIKRAELQPEAEAPKPEEPVAEQQPEQPPVEEAPKVAAEQAPQPEAEKPAEAATSEQPEQAEKPEPKKEPEPEPEPVPAPEDMPMPPPEPTPGF